MRRSHQETQEMVAARRSDFVAGDASEDVFLASLKALGLDDSERKYELHLALTEKEVRKCPPKIS